MFAKFLKCQFGVNQVTYLGHIITSERVEVDPEKIKAIQDWPVPLLVTSLRGFLGLKGYYNKFVHYYALIASPLTYLLKKQGFNWIPQADAMFTKLKKAMASLLVLGILDFN